MVTIPDRVTVWLAPHPMKASQAFILSHVGEGNRWLWVCHCNHYHSTVQSSMNFQNLAPEPDTRHLPQNAALPEITSFHPSLPTATSTRRGVEMSP